MTSLRLGSHQDKWMRFTYDFAEQGGDVGAIELQDEHGVVSKIPENTVVLGWYIEPETALASDGAATLSVGLDDDGAGNFSVQGAGFMQSGDTFDDPGFDPSSQILYANADNTVTKIAKVGGAAVIVTVADDPLTDGKFHVHVNVRAGVDV